VTLATHEGPLVAYADVVLPVSSWAEEDGTFVNAQGLAQRSERAIAPQGQSRPGWRVLAELAIALGHPLGLGRLRDIHGAMAEGEATGARGAAE
jgi:predicted molibdopterin-dependent oxidoreductase YjgC